MRMDEEMGFMRSSGSRRTARLSRGGSGSMYPDRAYDRVQLEGFSDEVAMYAPQPLPPYASFVTSTPAFASVSVQVPMVVNSL